VARRQLARAGHGHRGQRAAGRSIGEIFTLEGEASFRRRGRSLHTAITREGIVVALGGGATLTDDVRLILGAASCSAWATVETVEARLTAATPLTAARPLVSGSGARIAV
jgi:shikimate kinase